MVYMPYVLLIEDDPQTARLVQKILQARGIEVHHAANGFDGIKSAREKAPDIILVDMDLPDLDGKVVVLRLRSILGYPLPLLVAFTAQSGAEAKKLALMIGCNDFISKPIDTR